MAMVIDVFNFLLFSFYTMQLTAIVHVNIVFSHLVSCTALHLLSYNSEAVTWAARAVAMALGY
jgi:hypothetical protein